MAVNSRGVEETLPNQLECGRDVRKSLLHTQPPLLSRPGDPGAHPCIPEGCKERDLEQETEREVSKMELCLLPQISQVCQLCQQSPRLFSNHAAQLHTLLVSFFFFLGGETWEFCVPPGIPEGRFPGNYRSAPCAAGGADPHLETLWKRNSSMPWAGRGTSHHPKLLQQFLERKIPLFCGENSRDLAFAGYF